MSLLLLFIVISSFVSICFHWCFPVKNSIKGKCTEFNHFWYSHENSPKKFCKLLSSGGSRNKYKCTQSFADNYSCGEFPRGSVSDVGGGRPLWETTLWLHWSGSQLCKSHSFPCGHLHIQASLFPLPFQHWWPLVPLLWQEQALAVATVTELEIVRPKEMQQLLYGMKHLYVSRRLRFGVLVCFLHLYDRRFTWAVFGVTSI